MSSHVPEDLRRAFTPHRARVRWGSALFVVFGIGIGIYAVLADTDLFGHLCGGSLALAMALMPLLFVASARKEDRMLRQIASDPASIVWITCTVSNPRRPGMRRVGVYDRRGQMALFQLKAADAASALFALRQRCPHAVVTEDAQRAMGLASMWRSDPATFIERVRVTPPTG